MTNARRRADLIERMTAYEAGYDCEMYGANTGNCHFRYFTTPELTKSWERGRRAAKRKRK